MSDGQIISNAQNGFNGPSELTSLVTDTASATNTGVWIDARFMDKFSLDVTGPFVGTVAIMGSNAATIPANATDGNIIQTKISGGSYAATITTTGIYDSGVDYAPVRWIKAKVTAYTSGSISVILHGTQGVNTPTYNGPSTQQN